MADQVAVGPHEASCSFPDLIVYLGREFPESATEEVPRNGFEIDLVMIPDRVESRFLNNSDISTSRVMVMNWRYM